MSPAAGTRLHGAERARDASRRVSRDSQIIARSAKPGRPSTGSFPRSTGSGPARRRVGRLGRPSRPALPHRRRRKRTISSRSVGNSTDPRGPNRLCPANRIAVHTEQRRPESRAGPGVVSRRVSTVRCACNQGNRCVSGGTREDVQITARRPGRPAGSDGADKHVSGDLDTTAAVVNSTVLLLLLVPRVVVEWTRHNEIAANSIQRTSPLPEIRRLRAADIASLLTLPTGLLSCTTARVSNTLQPAAQVTRHRVPPVTTYECTTKSPIRSHCGCRGCNVIPVMVF